MCLGSQSRLKQLLWLATEASPSRKNPDLDQVLPKALLDTPLSVHHQKAGAGPGKGSGFLRLQVRCRQCGGAQKHQCLAI